MRTRFILISALLLATAIAVWHHPKGSRVSPVRRFELYDWARFLGRNDNLTPRSRDPHRHADQLGEYRELADAAVIFARGYNDGFDQHPEETMSDEEADYDHEYRRGLLDYWHHRQATSDTAGYRDGFQQDAHRYHRPY